MRTFFRILVILFFVALVGSCLGGYDDVQPSCGCAADTVYIDTLYIDTLYIYEDTLIIYRPIEEDPCYIDSAKYHWWGDDFEPGDTLRLWMGCGQPDSLFYVRVPPFMWGHPSDPHFVY